MGDRTSKTVLNFDGTQRSRYNWWLLRLGRGACARHIGPSRYEPWWELLRRRLSDTDFKVGWLHRVLTWDFKKDAYPDLLVWLELLSTYPARPFCWSGWISDSYCSLKPLCSGMGDVPARTSPTLLPPSPRTVLSLSCFKVSQYINCR